MTSNIPRIVPPKTPTPPASDEIKENSQNEGPFTIQTTITFKTPSYALTPGSDRHFGSMNTPLLYSDGSTSTTPIAFSAPKVSDGPMTLYSNLGKRRGHRYKHSSVSAHHQIFLEPPPRAPLTLPASLPIPTWKEAWSSRSKEQSRRIVWCACHALVALYVLYSAAGSLALTALSHLIFFDATSATICVAIDVLGNFEVWKRSSIRHPFGLERAEVLAGFAMSVFLLFMGFDLISHNLKNILKELGSDPSQSPDALQRVSPDSVDLAALLSIIATMISAIGLKNHARIGRTMRYIYISSLPSVLSNPSHFLTLFSSTVMLLLPLLTTTVYHWLDRLLCSLIAMSMFALGVHCAATQARMLLMSYSGEGVDDVIQEIKQEDAVVRIEEAKFWQVHYALCIANLKLRVSGDETLLPKLREKIHHLISNRLGGDFNKGEVRWDVTTQFTLEG
ncbi:hypothetical protein K3495_g4965 [Podosphaera aphanis]|nr:hypothetical protein K3495_g4965 [Podosphaera aphanis]